MKQTLDFIVIGAQKAGTTSLFEYLRLHPDLCLPADKEAPYFSGDDTYAQNWNDYLKSIFALANPDRKWGTVTPQYMLGGVFANTSPTDGKGTIHRPATAVADGRYDERTVPIRIREQLPNVRLVAILRDPVERARSHHQMATMNGFEERSFDTAVQEQLRPEALEHARRYPAVNTGYVTWGEYARILQGYFDVFPREQILVLYTQDLERAPERLLNRLHEFLGASTDFLPDNLGRKYRVGTSQRRLSWLGPDGGSWPAPVKGLKHIVANKATLGIWRALPEPKRHRINSRLDRAVYRLDLWNQREKPNVDGATLTTLTCLREHYRPDSNRLCTLLSESSPWQSTGATWSD